ncbi:hypothetical protein BAUCODRAFT_129851 [Baudoinia panamericana UAMH 10762]|uniref:Chromate transporter n=1 Tax=Baudoinia panamericana (strain UAMH 10762) TaxID=717646 RepID=M2NFR6_BAUPA|nr:uncharacterized protein BAUCODRAFT_129851 [Baudoinia panamericana UAMH 10762]EMC98099.1 hypothetical protein BAUCODRAFT_129851 [Baudoinia panamericana UAMH 10762]
MQLQALSAKLWATFATNWSLGFTAFGGPNVHFQIFRKKFVDDIGWIDMQVYQELFGICQATPGPASTKMLFCINAIHFNILAGLFAFLIWSLPGALGMYGLSLGIARVGDVLPEPVYALLTGLNAATVGIIALAAVQLAEKAITDRLTRLIVVFGGCAGILYTALWYFPVLLFPAGLATLVWDYRWPQSLGTAVVRLVRPRQVDERDQSRDIELQHAGSPDVPVDPSGGKARSRASAREASQPTMSNEASTSNVATAVTDEPRTVPVEVQMNVFSWQVGALLIAFSLALLATVLVLRGVLDHPPRGISIFANLYLAGTIIFGGGPVVIPLLREYVVAQGWVSPRDFLLGLAIIQAFPGPNFNFAVYLGSLSALHTPLPTAVGALVAYLGIFAPGLLISAGLMGIWTRLRSQRWLKSFLRGVNALAVGLVFTAVYKLWQIGYIDAEHSVGQPLGTDAWWVVVTATSFTGSRWFGLNVAAAILLGGVMGLVWYGVRQA